MVLTQEDFEDALHEQTKLFGGAAERFRNAIKLENKFYPERVAARASNHNEKEAHMLERIAAIETIVSTTSVSQADVRRYTRVARWDYVHQAHGLDQCGATFRLRQHSNSLIIQGAAAIQYFDDLTRRVFIEDADAPEETYHRHVLASGDRVMIFGLTSKAGKLLNGKVAVIRSSLDVTTKRYQCEVERVERVEGGERVKGDESVEGDEKVEGKQKKQKKIKASNLRLTPAGILQFKIAYYRRILASTHETESFVEAVVKRVSLWPLESFDTPTCCGPPLYSFLQDTPNGFPSPDADPDLHLGHQISIVNSVLHLLNYQMSWESWSSLPMLIKTCSHEIGLQLTTYNTCVWNLVNAVRDCEITNEVSEMFLQHCEAYHRNMRRLSLENSVRVGADKRIASKCENCGAAETEKQVTLRLCSGCKSIHFCSVACQRKLWPQHKHECRVLQKEQSSGSSSGRSSSSRSSSKKGGKSRSRALQIIKRLGEVSSHGGTERYNLIANVSSLLHDRSLHKELKWAFKFGVVDLFRERVTGEVLVTLREAREIDGDEGINTVSEILAVSFNLVWLLLDKPGAGPNPIMIPHEERMVCFFTDGPAKYYTNPQSVGENRDQISTPRTKDIGKNQCLGFWHLMECASICYRCDRPSSDMLARQIVRAFHKSVQFPRVAELVLRSLTKPRCRLLSWLASDESENANSSDQGGGMQYLTMVLVASLVVHSQKTFARRRGADSVLPAKFKEKWLVSSSLRKDSRWGAYIYPAVDHAIAESRLVNDDDMMKCEAAMKSGRPIVW